MAASRSAPELVTGIIGAIVESSSHVIVGENTGTLVGSSTFNLLFVLAICCFFTKVGSTCLEQSDENRSFQGELSLSSWSLLRDISFYVLAIVLCMVIYLDETIVWWEAVILLDIYAWCSLHIVLIECYCCSYCVLMAFNAQLRQVLGERALCGSEPVTATVEQNHENGAVMVR